MFQRVLAAVAGLYLGFVPGVSAADDLALVISNQRYGFDGSVGTAGAASQLARDLRVQGWTVSSGGEVSAPDMRDMAMRLHEAMRDSRGPDRVIVALTGQFAQSARDLWLLQSRSGKPDMLTAGADGLSIGGLADLLRSGAAGQAIVLLGLPETAPDPDMGLRKVTGLADIPQGVTLVIGPMAALQVWASESLLQPGKSLNAALAALPETARARGFRSGAVSFGPATPASTAPAGGVYPWDAPMGEMAYWNAVSDIGTAEAFEAYLGRFPRGAFAEEARAQIATLAPPDPREVAREGEAALGLSRNDRRQVQRNLDLLGYDPRGIDGVFGRGSRAAITAWQGASGYPPNGFLTAAQVSELQRQADVRAAELEREARERRAAEERADRRFWQSLGRDEDSLRRYLERYPDGLFAEEAQGRLDRILRERRDAAEARERAAWDRAANQNTVAAYRAFLEQFPEGSFADEAKKRINELRAEAQNAEAIAQLKQAEARVVPGQPGRLIVEQILAARGLKPGPVDGQFTRETRRAIRRFQRDSGLSVNGYVTQRTMVLLMLGR